MPMKKWTLVIHAPDARAQERGSPTFQAVLASGVGKGYAIFKKDISKLTPGSTKIVLLRKDGIKRRAEGFLDKWVPTNRKTSQGIQRYDIYVKKWTEIPYKPERLNPFGVAWIDC